MAWLLNIVVMLAFCLTGAAAVFAKGAMVPVNPGILTVSVGQKSDAGFDQKELTGLVCENVAGGLVKDGGVFGLGIFTKISCDSKDAAVGETAFLMAFEADAKTARIRISMAASQKADLPVAAIGFRHDGLLTDMLEDQAFSTLLAFALLDQLPMQIRFDGGVRVKRHKVTDGEHALLTDGLKLPDSYFAFSGVMDGNGLIYPSVLGRILLKTPQGKKSSYLHESGGNSTLVWRLETRMKSLPSSLYGLASAGRSEVGKGLQEEVDARAGRLLEEINENVISKSAKAIGVAFGGGFLGLRMGPALLEEELIDQSQYLGALVEFRSGWLNRLRIYYDYLPEVKGTINGQEGSFGGKRTILAYSLSLKFESWIRRIDLTPKVGLWNFRSKVPLEVAPNEYETPEFEVKRAPSFDVEIGIESASSMHILRGWISRAATFVSAGGDGAKITSSRLGMDLLLSPWGATSPVTISLLSFYFFEAVELYKTPQPESEEASIDELFYQQAYAGGGLAISW